MRRRSAGQPALRIQERLAEALDMPLAYFYAEDDDLARLIARCKRKPGAKAKPGR